jgi:hypothetical protein
VAKFGNTVLKTVWGAPLGWPRTTPGLLNFCDSRFDICNEGTQTGRKSDLPHLGIGPDLTAVRIIGRACGRWHSYSEGLVAHGQSMVGGCKHQLGAADDYGTAEEEGDGKGANGDLHNLASDLGLGTMKSWPGWTGK